MIKKSLLTIVLIIFFIGVYKALTFAQGRDCIHNGRRYPDGTIIGGYQCQDGRWVRTR